MELILIFPLQKCLRTSKPIDQNQCIHFLGEKVGKDVGFDKVNGITRVILSAGTMVETALPFCAEIRSECDVGLQRS